MSALPEPFIVGVARSGTTLLRFMLDQHPLLSILPETHFVPALVRRFPLQDPVSAKDFLTFVTSQFTWPDFGLPVDVLEQALHDSGARTPADHLRAFYETYARQHGKPGWGDKTPPYVGHLASIAQLFPDARIIHLIRDGRAVAASRRHLDFGPGSDVADQAADWVGKIRAARTQAARCAHYLEVRYEDLVSAPEATLITICEYLQIDYVPDMLEYPSSASRHLERFRDWRSPSGDLLSAADYRRSIHQRTLEPIDTARISDWRNALTAAEIERFESVAGGLLAELGYSLHRDG